jgi:hypothetical protein
LIAGVTVGLLALPLYGIRDRLGLTPQAESIAQLLLDF